MNAYDFLVSADVSDESVALVDSTGRSWLYQDVRILVEHLCGYIEESSYLQDRCLIYAGNGMFWVCCYLATLRTGRIAVPVPAAPASIRRCGSPAWDCWSPARVSPNASCRPKSTRTAG